MTGLELRLIMDVSEAASHTASPHSRRLPAPRYAMIALLALTTLFVFADQNLMAPNLTAIARSFGFTDEERDQKLGGDIAVAFFLLGAPISLMVGAMTDEFNRKNLFVAVVLLGEGPCLATGERRYVPACANPEVNSPVAPA